MNLGTLTNGLSPTLENSEGQLESDMHGDLTDPQNWAQIQQDTMMVTNEIGLESSEISAVKTMISSILQHM